MQYLQVRLSLPIDCTLKATLDYPSNIRLGWKALPGANAPAYSVTLSVTNTTLAPIFYVMKPVSDASENNKLIRLSQDIYCGFDHLKEI